MNHDSEYHKHKIAGTVKELSRFEDGNVHSIITISKDGLEFSHSIDLVAPSAVETSMTPFLDNGHIDKTHKYRIGFQGVHVLTTGKNENQGQRPARINPPPTYTFFNEKGSGHFPSNRTYLTDFLYPDFLEFQSLLLQNKQVKHCVDFNVMECSKGKVQSRLGNIRILLDPDPIFRMRSVLYFRKTNDPKPGFVEWPGKF